MLLWICKPECIATDTLITEKDLLPEFNEDVLDTPLPPVIQHRFTQDAWMAVIQQGS